MLYIYVIIGYVFLFEFGFEEKVKMDEMLWSAVKVDAIKGCGYQSVKLKLTSKEMQFSL